MFEQNVTFGRAVQQEDRKNISNLILDAYEHSPKFENLIPNTRRRELTVDERIFLSDQIEDIKKTLSTFGANTTRFSHGIDISLENIEIYEVPKEKTDLQGALFSPEGHILIMVPSGFDLKNPLLRRLLSHELSHMTTRSVYMTVYPKGRDSRIRQSHFGYERMNYSDETRSSIRSRGLYSEPLAELFSYYDLPDEATEFESPYSKSMPFFVSLIKDFAIRSQKSELDVFQRMYSAFTVRSFTIQKELRDQYGTEFMRLLNTIEISTIGEVANDATFDRMLQLGGFRDLYDSISSEINTTGITLFNKQQRITIGEAFFH